MNGLKHGNFTAAARQSDKEHRQLMRQHRQAFNELIAATHEYLDLVAQHEYLDLVEKIF